MYRRPCIIGCCAALLLEVGCGSERDAAQPRPVHPVTMQGRRFAAGGETYVPTTNFLTAGVPRQNLTHIYLSHEIGDGDRARMRQVLRREGYNAIFIFTLNDGDHGSHTTPYQRGPIGGAFDEARLARWRSELERLLGEGLRPVLWLFADDSPAVHRADAAELRRYIREMVARFDDLPVMWVLGLEVDEYWSRERSDALGSYLAERSRHPVGVHQTAGRTDYMTAPWVEFGAYQSARKSERGDGGVDWAFLYQDFLRAREGVGDRPLIAAEYDWQIGGREAQARGLALGFAGAAGLGNGAPRGLDVFLAALPAGLLPDRSGATLWLRGEQLSATADLETLGFACEGCTSIAGAAPEPTETGP